MKINLYAAINGSGYGVVVSNMFRSLLNIPETNISYFPVATNCTQARNDQEHALIIQALREAHSFDAHAPCLKIWHQHDLASRIGKGAYYAHPIFELDTFSNQELSHLRVPDSIFVSSHWAQQILEDNKITTPSFVIPLGVDLSIFNKDILYSRAQYAEKYDFLNVGKWEIRKGHDVLREIFDKAFPTETDVELWILASEMIHYSNPEELEAWKKRYESDRIKVIPGLSSQQEVAGLMSMCDCGIYPSRAEGWNLELLEMMAMNKPVIATNYSAHTEFCDQSNCYLIDIDDKEKAYDGKAFQGQGNWAKIGPNQIELAIVHMRNVYENRIMTNPEGLKTATRLTWANSAEIAMRCMSH